MLDTKYIKVGLEINGEEYGSMSLENVKNIIDSDVIYEKEMISYSLRIWLDKTKEEEILKLEDYTAFLKLKVEAEQRVESMDKDKTTVFNYTGKPEEYIVPRDGYYYIEMGGASSAPVNDRYSNGAKTSGYIELKAGEKLYFYVGKQGTKMNENCRSTGYEFNGGGIALSAKSGICGPTGGGATDVRLVGGSWDNTNSLISRIMVAGGAGSPDSSSPYTLGHGGTLYGEKILYSTYQSYLANPGTQISGGIAPTKYSSAQSTGTAGSFGKGEYGGANQSTSTSGGGSGGGSGYYGVSGSSGLSNGIWGGSGGSSYISGYAGVNSVKESTTITHTNGTLHYSGKYFVGAKMIEGQSKGNGYAKITYVDTKPKRRNAELNNVRYIKDCSSYNSANSQNHWIELQAIKDGVNIAKGKTVTGTTSQNASYPYSRITDGDITYSNYTTSTSYTTNQCITVDLGSTYDLDEIAVWNYFGDQRSYYDNITYVSNDNSTWTKIINEANVQNSNGRRINAYTDTYNGYVQDNLILWYDGYANTGLTRDTATATWKDLSGNNNNGTSNASGNFYDNYYLANGTSNTITTPVVTNNILANDKDWTMNTYFQIHYISKSNTSIGNAGTIFGASYYSGAGFFWYRETNSDLYHLYIGKRANAVYHTYNPDELAYEVNSAPHYATIVHDYTNRKIRIYIKDNKVVEEDLFLNEAYYDASSIGNVGISKAQMLGGSYTVSYTGLRMFKAQIYNKALTEDEVMHNYLYDKQKFNLE